MLVSGGFDPVHKGHLEMIEKAEEMADEVWVILNNEHWLQQKKGKSFMPEKEREYIMSRIKGVTKTFICNPRTPTDKSVCDGIYSAVMTYRREYDDELSIEYKDKKCDVFNSFFDFNYVEEKLNCYVDQNSPLLTTAIYERA